MSGKPAKDYFHWVCARSLSDAVERINNGEMAVTYIPRSKDSTKGDVSSLAELLMNNTTCRALAVKRSLIDAKRAKVYAEMLKVNTKLSYLSLGFVNDQGAQSLAESLKHNSTLTSLHFPHNSITEEGGCAIAAALEMNNTLTTIDLGRASCNQATFNIIEAILLQNIGKEESAILLEASIDFDDSDFLKISRQGTLKGFLQKGLFRKTSSQADSIRSHYSISSSTTTQHQELSSENPQYKPN